MADVANEIIQTLEEIHNDIKSAKDTLKANNVTLESQFTSTLSSEIGHVGDALKNADSLLGFKKGELNMEHGFIYSVNDGELNNSNTLMQEADEYKFPNKTISFSFPSKYLIDKYNDTKKVFKVNALDTYNLYGDILEPLYKSSMENRITYCLPGNTQYALNVELNHDNITVDSDGYCTFDEFVFPNVNTDFYLKSNESENSGTLITKFKINKFHFSLSYRGKDVTIKCDELHINLDTVSQEINDPVGHSSNCLFYTDGEFYSRNDDSDAYIIYMPNFNVQYDNYSRDNMYTSLDEYFAPNGIFRIPDNIQIRIDETPDNLAKLREDTHIVNILRLLRIFNTAGDKQYNPTSKKFEPAGGFIPDIILDKCLEDKNLFLSMQTTCVLDNTSLYKTENGRNVARDENYILSNIFNNLTIIDGCYYVSNSFKSYGKITKNLFMYTDSNKHDISNWPIWDFDDNVLSFEAGKLDGSSKLKVTPTRDDSVSPILPTLNLSLLNAPYSSNTYNGVEFIIVSAYQENPPYYKFDSAAKLLASPFDAEFKDISGSSITDFSCQSAPLVYNEHIKSVKIHHKLWSLIGLGIVYQTPVVENKPSVPAKPMRFILDNDAIISPSGTTTYLDVIRNNGIIGLGPYSTDELAKYYDKFVHVCINENHPKLGTYDFCKFRVPLYNLDETKKYNYSKKTWELVTALTDDSDDMSTIYPEEYSKSSVTTAYNPGYELSL